MSRWCLLLVLLCQAVRPGGLFAADARPDGQVRRGLPTTARIAQQGGELRVAFLGGSITAADGWRPWVTARLGELMPAVTITAFNAGLPGTGSDLGVCRLGPDVLRHRPDLIFVEFAVNDAKTPPEQVERTMEGIVRQTWREWPGADLVFVYTVSTPGLADFQAGRWPGTALAMERVAEHYGLPSLHVGADVARRCAAGALVFKGTAADGERAFSLDGVHPTPAGHRLYADGVSRALPEWLAAPQARPALPAALRADNWERAGLLSISGTQRTGDWQPVAPDDPNLQGVTKALLPPTWRAAAAGACIEFTFTGTRLGLLGIAAPDSGRFQVTIDDGPPVGGTLFDAYASPTFCRVEKWFFPRELAPGRHRVRVELLAEPVDKVGIKGAAGKTIDDPAPYAPQRLTLSGLLWIDAPIP